MSELRIGSILPHCEESIQQSAVGLHPNISISPLLNPVLFPSVAAILSHVGVVLRASPAVEGPQAEIRRYLAPNRCKFWLGEAHVSSGELRTHFEFKLKDDEKRRTLMKFDET
jgi:hypothetical protein